MRFKVGVSLLLVAGFAAAWSVAHAEEIKCDSKFGGAFNVKAITGDSKGKTFCYV